MVSTPRSFARSVLVDGFPGSMLRHYVFRSEARRAATRLSSVAKSSGLNALSLSAFDYALSRRPTADTFFVLGSGASIEELNANQFAEIASQCSVGINTWPVHPFVPDILSFESVPYVGDGQDFPRNLSFLHREDIVAKAPLILVLNPKSERELEHLAVMPEALRSSTYLYSRVSPVTRSETRLASDISYFFSHLLQRNPGILLDSGASVVRMIVLGIALGFRRIVLAGVDLNGSRYFWEENPSYLERSNQKPKNNQQGSGHETMTAKNRPFSVASMVVALDSYFRSKFAGSIEIASDTSALSGLLAPAEWRG